MLLTIDIGNTTCSLAFYQQDQQVFYYSTKSNLNKTYDEFLSAFKEFLHANCIKNGDIEGCIISSVVPSLTPIWNEIIEASFNIKSYIVGPRTKTGVRLNIDNPSELGADLACDIVAALDKYGPSTLIVDLGTATKYLVIDKDGAFSGAVICPGMKLSFNALTKGTALLSDVELSVKKNVIGKNTKDCLNSGIINGTIYQIKGFSEAIEKELGYKLNKVITGGYSKYLTVGLEDYKIDKNLLFDGLRILFYKNNK